MKKLTAIIVTLVLALFASTPAFASDGYGCQPIYGGGETCVQQGTILVNKMIQNPTNGQFVDNLTNSTDPKFNPNQNVSFQISVINTGSATIDSATAIDTLPGVLTFVSGPGSYNASTRQITFTVTNLLPNEQRVYTIVAKVNANIATGVSCDPVNLVTATASNGQSSTDNSRFCVQNQTPPTTKGGLPIYPVPQKQFTTPATGPEDLPLLGIFGSAISGLILRKRSSK